MEDNSFFYDDEMNDVLHDDYLFSNAYVRRDLHRILDIRVQQYEETFGTPDKVIDTFFQTDGYCVLENQCRYYNQVKHLIIITFEKLYVIPYNKILGYEIIDVNEGVTQTPLYSATITTTTTDTGNIVKRAIIGGLLAGGVGAIVGGTTARKKSTSQISQVDEYAAMLRASIPDGNYALIINVDDIIAPTIRIPYDVHKDKAKELAASLNVIIKRNAEGNDVDNSKVITESSDIKITGELHGIKPTDLNEKWEDSKQIVVAEREKEAQDNNTRIVYVLLAAITIIACILFFVLIFC